MLYLSFSFLLGLEPVTLWYSLCSSAWSDSEMWRCHSLCCCDELPQGQSLTPDRRETRVCVRLQHVSQRTRSHWSNTWGGRDVSGCLDHTGHLKVETPHGKLFTNTPPPLSETEKHTIQMTADSSLIRFVLCLRFAVSQHSFLTAHWGDFIFIPTELKEKSIHLNVSSTVELKTKVKLQGVIFTCSYSSNPKLTVRRTSLAMSQHLLYWFPWFTRKDSVMSHPAQTVTSTVQKFATHAWNCCNFFFIFFLSISKMRCTVGQSG